MSYFFIIEGEQVGPIGIDQIRERIEEGKINLDTPVWKEGMDRWGRVRGIAELLGRFPDLAGSRSQSSSFEPPYRRVAGRASGRLERKYAELGSRLASGLIDFLILIVPVLIATAVVPLLGGALVSVFYFAYLMTGRGGGQTLGDRVMKVATVDEARGRPMGYREAILWALMYNLLGWIGWMWYIFDDRKRMLHNIASRTVTYRQV